MIEEIREECGILGIYLKDGTRNNSLLVQLAKDGLTAIQNRGQNGAGIVVKKIRDPNDRKRTLDPLKSVGTVHRLFGLGDSQEFQRICREYAGVSLIGHVRYGTSGKRVDDDDYVQPFLRRHGKIWKRFALGFNGNIANYSELEKELIGTQYDLETNVDTELLMHLFSRGLNFLSQSSLGNSEKPDFVSLARECMPKMDGAYNLVFLFGDGEMGVIRDPNGFKPLFYGENNQFHVVASETTALTKLNIPYENIKTVPLGSAMTISEKPEPEPIQIIEPKPSHCHFEAIYFSDVASRLEEVPIHTIRKNLGDELANDESPEILKKVFLERPNWVVTYAPESAFEAASRFSWRLGLSLERGLKKANTDDQGSRLFITPGEERPSYMSLRYGPIREVFYDKDVFIVDDSLVRGDTMRNLLMLIKEIGKPKSIHVRITEPPIISPCFYGIDMSTHKQLLANKFPELSGEELNLRVANYLGVDSFRYQTLRGLENAFGERFKGKLCTACISGIYPTEFGKIRAQESYETWKSC